MTPIRVLIVDDSKLVRQILTEILNQHPQIEVVGAAEDPFEARDMIKQLKPDVLTLDVEMPRMDGITFLKNLMRLHPMPVVMLSTLTQKGADTTLEALEIGAVDYIAKPKSEHLMGNLSAFNSALYNKVKFAATVDVRSFKSKRASDAGVVKFTKAVCPDTIIAIGASTGGTEAIRDVLLKMPSNSPPVVITQHIPESFSKRFAQRLNSQCNMTVHEATDEQVIEQGHAYVAPGGKHLKVIYRGGRYRCKLCDSQPVNRHKPSVDVMFDSLAMLPGVKVYIALLTGMGGDGAKGMLGLKEKGHYSLIQDKRTSLIWGMPGSAFEINAHCEQSSLDNIAQTLLNSITHGTRSLTRSRNVTV